MSQNNQTVTSGSGDSYLQLLSARRVAALLGVHVRTVWRLAAAGELPPPVKVGGATRWRLIDIQNYIDGR